MNTVSMPISSQFLALRALHSKWYLPTGPALQRSEFFSNTTSADNIFIATLNCTSKTNLARSPNQGIASQQRLFQAT